MATIYGVNIGADFNVNLQAGWSLQMTANGRNVFVCAIRSLDASYRPALDATVAFYEGVPILTSSVANPTVITTEKAHGIITGRLVTIYLHTGSTPVLDADYTATVLTPTTFTVPVNVTTGGTGGGAYRRIFGGRIVKVSESGVAGGLGKVAITTRIEAASYDALADRRYYTGVLAAGSLESMLNTLATACGFTMHADQPTGPDLAALPCTRVLLRAILDNLSELSGGYVWEWDAFNVMRMYPPSAATEAAPLNIIEGDGNAVGDIIVEPTRTDYANRVIVHFSESATQAYAFLVATADFANGETVTLGSKTYTFQDELTNVDGNVHVGGSAEASLDNLAAAIVLGAGSGTAYAAAMTVNSSAEAYVRYRENWEIVAKATQWGVAGNSVACTETAANASWITEGGGGTVTLAFGADESLTNIAQAPAPETEPTAEQTAHDVWETLIDAPEIFNLTDANTLAAARLATGILTPNTVRYNTCGLGLCPGQVQTITVPKRAIDGSFLITDVVSQANRPKHVQWSVTAIESLVLQTVRRWQDFFKGLG